MILDSITKTLCVQLTVFMSALSSYYRRIFRVSLFYIKADTSKNSFIKGHFVKLWLPFWQNGNRLLHPFNSLYVRVVQTVFGRPQQKIFLSILYYQSCKQFRQAMKGFSTRTLAISLKDLEKSGILERQRSGTCRICY